MPELQPRFITKKQAVKVIGSRRLVERMIADVNRGGTWLRIVPPRPGVRKRENLIDLQSVHTACDRLLRGEHPPLFPSEKPKGTQQDEPNL